MIFIDASRALACPAFKFLRTLVGSRPWMWHSTCLLECIRSKPNAASVAMGLTGRELARN